MELEELQIQCAHWLKKFLRTISPSSISDGTATRMSKLDVYYKPHLIFRESVRDLLKLLPVKDVNCINSIRLLSRIYKQSVPWAWMTTIPSLQHRLSLIWMPTPCSPSRTRARHALRRHPHSVVNLMSSLKAELNPQKAHPSRSVQQQPWFHRPRSGMLATTLVNLYYH